MALSDSSRNAYTKIIDALLASSDLTTISAKQIRKALQESVEHDITSEKEAINALIVERFDHAESQQAGPNGLTNEDEDTDNDKTISNGNTGSIKHERDSGATSDSLDDKHLTKKKPRVTADDDAAFAARLQAEENSRSRTTRGTSSGKKATTKVTKKKKKSAARVKGDASDLESGDNSEKSVNRSGAFHKPYALSQPLAELVGETTLSRPQTVKKIWEYVKANSLQNPSDKRQIVCDDTMRAVFKSDTVHMFTMNKILGKHLYPEGE